MASASHIVSLIAAPGSQAIDAGLVAHIAELAGTGEGRWLAPGEAWEADVPADVAELATRAVAIVQQRPVDVNVVVNRGAKRRKALLVADMESTIIEQECLDELAEYAGVRPRIAEITERAMRGELDFEAALKERVGLLAGLDAAVLQEIYDRRVSLMPGAQTLIATLKAHGAACALVSGGFTFYTEKIAARLGFDVQQANRLELAGGKIAGTVAAPILGREAKLEALQRLARERGLTAEDCIATGDGANDLAMIKAAGLGVAFRAKPIVAAEAAASLRHGDLTGCCTFRATGPTNSRRRPAGSLFLCVARFGRAAGVFPGLVAADHVRDRLEPHVLRRFCSERRAQAPSAEEHEFLVLAELRLVVGAFGVDPEFEHATVQWNVPGTLPSRSRSRGSRISTSTTSSGQAEPARPPRGSPRSLPSRHSRVACNPL